MEDKIYESQMQMIKILIANTSSAMKISKIMCEHGNTDVLTGDHIICGLIYRLIIPMTDIEIEESLGFADDIMEGSSDEEDYEDDIEIVEDEDSITERKHDKVQVNDCNCDVCKKIRECMIKFNDYTPKDELGDKFKNSIIETCNKYNRFI
jgi:hypothetical protein